MLILFYKPYGVLCQFSGDTPNLSEFIPIAGVYPAGRLDKDSEGLLLLTDDGRLQDRLAHPKHGHTKTYWVQVDGAVTDSAIQTLKTGVLLNDGPAIAVDCSRIDPPEIAPRNPPIRVRQQIPTSWLVLTLDEGRNRQVRRMTAAVGFPTLRLIRVAHSDYTLDDLDVGAYRVLDGTRVESAHANTKHPRHRRHVRRR